METYPVSRILVKYWVYESARIYSWHLEQISQNCQLRVHVQVNTANHILTENQEFHSPCTLFSRLNQLHTRIESWTYHRYNSYLFIYCHLYSAFSIVQCSNALYRLWDGEIQEHTGQPSVREIDANTMYNQWATAPGRSLNHPRPKSITHLRTHSDNGVYVAFVINVKPTCSCILLHEVGFSGTSVSTVRDYTRKCPQHTMAHNVYLWYGGDCESDYNKTWLGS